MKIDKTSFGISYVKPSLQYLSKNNLEKVQKVIPLGELYPVDIFLGANLKGDLTIDIMQEPMDKFLFFNNELPPTIENLRSFYLNQKLRQAYLETHGNEIPIMHTSIKSIKDIEADKLPFLVQEKILEYYNKLGKKFIN